MSGTNGAASGGQRMAAGGEQAAKSGSRMADSVISRSSTIGDVVSKHPEVVESLLALGVHCVGCHVAYWESLEDGLRSHGFEEGEIDDAVRVLNDVIEKSGQLRGTAATGQTVQEGASGKLELSENAATKIREFLAKEKASGLKISVIPGGCSGFQYGFELLDEPVADDVVREVSGVKLFLDRDADEFLRGARIEYVDSIQGSGFRIVNPKAKVGCGCGKSFSA